MIGGYEMLRMGGLLDSENGEGVDQMKEEGYENVRTVSSRRDYMMGRRPGETMCPGKPHPSTQEQDNCY